MASTKEQRSRTSVHLQDDMDALTPPSSSDEDDGCVESRPSAANTALLQSFESVGKPAALGDEQQQRQPPQDDELLAPVAQGPSALDLILHTDDDEDEEDTNFFRGASHDEIRPRRSASLSNVLPVQQPIFPSGPTDDGATVPTAGSTAQAQGHASVLSVRDASRLASVRASWYRRHIKPPCDALTSAGAAQQDEQQQQEQSCRHARTEVSSLSAKKVSVDPFLWSPPQAKRGTKNAAGITAGSSGDRPPDDIAEWQDACEKAKQALLAAAAAAASSSARQHSGRSTARLAATSGDHHSSSSVYCSSSPAPHRRSVVNAGSIAKCSHRTATAAVATSFVTPAPAPSSSADVASARHRRSSSRKGCKEGSSSSREQRTTVSAQRSAPPSAASTHHAVHHEQRSSAMVVREDWTKYAQKIAFHDDEADVKALQKGGGGGSGKSKGSSGPKTVREIIYGPSRASEKGSTRSLRSSSPLPQDGRANLLSAVTIDSEDLVRRRCQADQVREKMLYYSNLNRRQAAMWQYRQDSAGAEPQQQHHYAHSSEAAPATITAMESASTTSHDKEAHHHRQQRMTTLGSLRPSGSTGGRRDVVVVATVRKATTSPRRGSQHRTPSPPSLGAVEGESLLHVGTGSSTARRHEDPVVGTPPRHRLRGEVDNQPKRLHQQQDLQQWQMLRQFAKQVAYQGRQCAAPPLVLPS